MIKLLRTLALATAALAASAAFAQTYKLRLGSVLTPADPLQLAAEGFKKSVGERSHGQIVVELYPNSQIGDSQQMMDAAMAGANVGTFVEASRLAPYVPEFNVLIAPYAFDSPADIARFADSELFAKWNRQLAEKAGLTLLSFNWFQGTRHVLSKKPVSKPEDLAGVRLRTIGQPLWTETMKAMGATPVPMPWGDVYAGLKSGLITGAEAQPSAIWGARLQEVVTHLTLTGHIHLMSGLLVSEKWLASLPPELRSVVVEEARRWGASATKANVEGAAKVLADVRKAGVTVSEIDVSPFREAVKPVYEQMKLTALTGSVRKSLGKM